MKDRDTKQARREIRKVRRQKSKEDRKVRQKIENQLAVDGVMQRVLVAQRAVKARPIVRAVKAAISEHEALRGPLKDYHTLRAVVSTALSLEGIDLRDLMLKFSWNGRDLGILVAPSVESIVSAAAAVKIDKDTAFKGMLAQ